MSTDTTNKNEYKNSKKRSLSPQSLSLLAEPPKKRSKSKGGKSPKSAMDDTESFPPFFMYGQVCNQNKDGDGTSGVCFGCRGSWDDKLSKDHPILLCDGPGCNREYHLRCVDVPLPLDQVPSGPFYCIDCIPGGTSQNLTSYFDAVDELRAEFQTSQAFVEFLLCFHKYGLAAKSILPKDHNVDIDEILRKVSPDAFDNVDDADDRDGDEQLTSFSCYSDDFPYSELARAADVHASAMSDPDFIRDALKIKTDTTPPLIGGPGAFDFDAEHVLGKVIRIYCPLGNQYHHGRVIDWRSAKPVDPNKDPDKHDFFGEPNYEILTSEFLVRFAAGVDGRKEEILKWIILEEHCCAVSVAIVMACRDRGRGINGWRPGQLVLRSAMELLPVKDLIIDSCYCGLIIFFGDENHLYTDIDEDAVDFFSPNFEKYRLSKLNASPNTSQSSYMQSTNELIEFSLNLARIEWEEQRRTFEWHKFISEDYAHPRCFSLKSEYSIPPLKIDGMKLSKDFSQITEGDESVHVRKIIPNLCPLIQPGLDRQWICGQLPDNSFTLDSISSISCSNGKSLSEKIELYNKQEQGRK